MNSVILYYSYSGHTKKIVKKLAKTQGAELIEIQTVKHHGKFLTYLLDCPRAMRHKSVPIQPITQDLSGYDLITLAAPVWAGNPAPAFNAAVALLPKHKNVQVIMVSAGGSTTKNEDAIKKHIRAQGCSVVAYKDMKQSK